MALTFADAGSLPYYIEGNRKRVVKTVTMDSSYASGGEVVTAADLGLNHIDYAKAQIKVNSNSSDSLVSVNFAKTDGQSGKLVFYEETPQAIDSGDNLSSCTVHLEAVGY